MKRVGLFVLALAACSGPAPGGTGEFPALHTLPSAAARTAPPARAVRGGVVFASDWFNNVVDVFDQNGLHQRPFMQFTQLNLEPAGLATDAKGNVYVAEAAGNGAYIFDLGRPVPFSYLDDAGHEPYAVAVDRSGNAYVANTFLLEDAGFVNYYPAGSTEAEYEITDPSFEYLYGMALDRHGNLYVSYVDLTGNGAVAKFPPGSSGPGHNLGLERGSYFGLAFDQHDDLVAANYYAGEIEVFARGASKPLRRFGHRGRPWSIAFNRQGTRLFVADFERNEIEEYAYPAGTLVDTIAGEKGGAFVGVATGL
ncbi:MAG TPA: NHL repeat-containing protein [Candidatus Cybelea sp.]|jgi:DNA-binding beta-propeller fold protein YncE